MPRRDGTGPDSKGPKTGRGLGPCDENISEYYDDRQVRKGLGPCGRGMANRRGFGRGNENLYRNGRRF